jgi:hypothetical protein
MARDEDGNILTPRDLFDCGYAVGLMLQPKASLTDGIEGELAADDRRALEEGYAMGVAETEAELKARDRAGEVAQPPVTGDEIPF